ncbi:TlpA family protein disulfide reductase [Marinobacter daepoensis]|uniref:TlpA family protein disulfide reductase n=1 Tax=Marinobacter daepoensis TaxID=262077 RepID=A0ABS3BIS9_9GAMM|nr:TlpA disulfide reductase family protein [Marinobacter daepoensis]MBN7771677.1 TlpA family protein disulfide reductase [Marinobacter daepoensis]MBY6034914.1 TlpA family protein disulfide reductase [Marinobacter daepoensis]MBY6080855.1 TlpA family protein disulfide reductase [Marinobacter daepoensis]
MQYPQAGLFCSRKRSLLLLILLIVFISGCEKVELERADGTPSNWDKYRGQWVLVNYWAEWCKPCLEEIPELNELDKAPDIAVLGVNFDGVSGAPLLELGERMGIEFTLLAADPGPDLGWQVPMALPATFVVDPDGALIEARFGPQTEEDIRAMIGE